MDVYVLIETWDNREIFVGVFSNPVNAIKEIVKRATTDFAVDERFIKDGYGLIEQTIDGAKVDRWSLINERWIKR